MCVLDALCPHQETPRVLDNLFDDATRRMKYSTNVNTTFGFPRSHSFISSLRLCSSVLSRPRDLQRITDSVLYLHGPL